jgi:hypothetical protein
VRTPKGGSSDYLVNIRHTQIRRLSSKVGIDIVRISAPTQKKKKKLLSAYSYQTRGKEKKSENTPFPKFTSTAIGNLPTQLKLIPHFPEHAHYHGECTHASW